MANLLVALLPRDPQQCDARYLYHLLQARKDKLLVPLMLGTANVSLKERDIAGVRVHLPPLEEQRNIVAWIDSLTVKMKETAALRNEVSKELQALIVATHIKLSGASAEPLSQYIELHEDAVKVEANLAYPQVGVRGFGGGLFSKAPIAGTETTYRTFNRLYEGSLVLSRLRAGRGPWR